MFSRSAQDIALALPLSGGDIDVLDLDNDGDDDLLLLFPPDEDQAQTARLTCGAILTGSPLGLAPIGVFLLLIISSALVTGSFATMPSLVAFAFATAFALALNPGAEKLSLARKIEVFCAGAGEGTIILLVVVFLLAGAFYAVTVDIGARDATVNLGLALVPDALLLPGLFLMASVISFAMGTSMGTITAIAPIGIGLAESGGFGVHVAMGAVIGGAMFGDNLSFISDTTIAATRTQRVYA